LLSICLLSEECSIKIIKTDWMQWLKPVILDIWKEEIRKITVIGQPRQKVHETPPPPHISNKSWACGVHLSLQLHCKAQLGGPGPG
jgi:hypothetical protein